MQCFTRLSKLATDCLSYNMSFSACFFSRVFLSQQITRNSVSVSFFSETKRAHYILLYEQRDAGATARNPSSWNVTRGATSDCVLRHGICFVLLAHFRPLQRTHNNSGRGGSVPGDAGRQRRRRRSRTPASASISFCFLLPGSTLNAGVRT